MGSYQSKPASAPATLSEKSGQQSEPVQQLTDSLAMKLDLSASGDSSGTVSLGDVKQWESKTAKDPKINLSRTVLYKSDLKATLVSPTAKVTDAHVYNTSVDFKTGPITSQKSSGRCWIFATTNVLRYQIMKKLSLKEFQLSQSYFFFYDKLEKSNYFLENSIELADEPLDSRLVSFLNKAPINDGGQWDMAVNILEKYGVVPQAIFPESFSSSSSGALNTLLTTKLREQALALREQYANLQFTLQAQGVVDRDVRDRIVRRTLEKTKEAYMEEIWTVLSIALGVPLKPDEKFTWDYYDEKDKAKSFTGTPLEFYKSFACKPYTASDSFSIVNDPRNEYNKLYSVNRLGNVWGGRAVLYVNAPIDRLKDVVVKSIKAGHPVFFGCDVGQSSDRSLGFMDLDLYDYENAFNIKLGLTKAQRMQVGESAMTHAMVISAVHMDQDGRVVRYKVENSWGDEVGDKGFFVMTDRWFEEFVYQVVVPKSLAPSDLVQVFESGEKTLYPAWDPMGTLA